MFSDTTRYSKRKTRNVADIQRIGGSKAGRCIPSKASVKYTIRSYLKAASRLQCLGSTGLRDKRARGKERVRERGQSGEREKERVGENESRERGRGRGR